MGGRWAVCLGGALALVFFVEGVAWGAEDAWVDVNHLHPLQGPADPPFYTFHVPFPISYHAGGQEAWAMWRAKTLPWPTVAPGAIGLPAMVVNLLLDAQDFVHNPSKLALYDKVTEETVRSFQRSVGVPSTGVVGPETWPHLVMTVTTATASPAILAMSTILRDGFGYAVEPRPTFDRDVERALLLFQKANGIASQSCTFTKCIDVCDEGLLGTVAGPLTWKTLIANAGNRLLFGAVPHAGDAPDPFAGQDTLSPPETLTKKDSGIPGVENIPEQAATRSAVNELPTGSADTTQQATNLPEDMRGQEGMSPVLTVRPRETWLVSAEDIKAIMPLASDDTIQTILPFLNTALINHNINTPIRIAAFLSQVAEETNQFHMFEEAHDGSDYEFRCCKCNIAESEDSTARKNYRQCWERDCPECVADGPDGTTCRTKICNEWDLGNCCKDDGKRFKGRGMGLQMVGRRMYRECGQSIKQDLEKNPGLMQDAATSYACAGWWWSVLNVNEVADKCDFEWVVRRVARGCHHFERRMAYYDHALEVLQKAQGEGIDANKVYCINHPRVCDQQTYDRSTVPNDAMTV